LIEERARALCSPEEGECVAPPTSDEAARVAAWTARRNAALSTPSRISPELVPDFKFATNDGWIVSPREAASIAAALESTLARSPAAFTDALAELEGVNLAPGEALAWIRQWVVYNRVAASNGGYRVE
jgi:hypothetical protein